MTRRFAALALVVVAAWLVRRLGGESELDVRSVGLGIGFALIAAGLTGELFSRAKLPRVTGYLLFGLICGPYMTNLITRAMARELQVINGLAVALIAFVAGLELNFQRVRSTLSTLVAYGSTALAVMYVGVFAVCWVIWPWLPILPEASGLGRIALAMLLATLILSFSPTITIAVIAESRARGPLSEFALALVICSDLVLIVAFTLTMQFVRWATNHILLGEVSLLAEVSWEIFGSLAFGAMVGAAFGFYLRFVGRELTIVLLAVCVVLSAVAEPLDFEPLLAALAAGLVVENIAPPRGHALSEAVERGALPVLVIFFAAAGASLELNALAVIGIPALIVSALRLSFIKIGTAVGNRVSGVGPPVRDLLWMCLVSQAGVTLGMTIIVADAFPEWGPSVRTLLVALIAMHELAGPVLLRAALARSGEIGKMDATADAAAALQPGFDDVPPPRASLSAS